MTKVMITADLKINSDIWINPYDSIKLILKALPPKKNSEI